MALRRTLRRTVDYPHPPEAVYAALTDESALASWLMPIEDYEPRVGCRFRFRSDPAPGFDGIIHLEVLELVPARRVRWAWRGGPIDTEVCFDLAPIPSGTRLSFRQSGFEGLPALAVSFLLGSGWRGLLTRRLLARLDDQG